MAVRKMMGMWQNRRQEMESATSAQRTSKDSRYRNLRNIMRR
jgi:hypothetical protein